MKTLSIRVVSERKNLSETGITAGTKPQYKALQLKLTLICALFLRCRQE